MPAFLGKSTYTPPLANLKIAQATAMFWSAELTVDTKVVEW